MRSNSATFQVAASGFRTHASEHCLKTAGDVPVAVHGDEVGPIEGAGVPDLAHHLASEVDTRARPTVEPVDQPVRY
jgi:hypothetical protein